MEKFRFDDGAQLATVLSAMHANGWKENVHYKLEDNILTIYNIDMPESVYFQANGGIKV